MTNTKQLILLAHGSRDPRWQQPFEALTQQLQTQVGEAQVKLAYMEMASPTLMDIGKASIAEGITTFTILPLFMAAGGHVSKDIPRLANELKQADDNITVTVLPPVGEHPLIVDTMAQIALNSVNI